MARRDKSMRRGNLDGADSFNRTTEVRTTKKERVILTRKKKETKSLLESVKLPCQRSQHLQKPLLPDMRVILEEIGGRSCQLHVQ